MKVSTEDRRLVRRHDFRAPLRLRIWKSAIPEQLVEAANISRKGIFFAADSLLRIGTTVEIVLKMPEEVTGEPAAEWACTGHVVRVESAGLPQGKVGIGVQFDCYEISRGK